jgi:CheY-like chemotaxis protein
MITGVEFERPIEILLVEDSPTDAQLTVEALRDDELRNNVHHAEDGEIAMSFLRREGSFAHAPRPDVILLDLNLPKKDGREVLAEIRSDPVLKSLVVIVLTTSRDERDIRSAYVLNANSYISKPLDFNQFTAVIGAVKNFFFRVIALPKNE